MIVRRLINRNRIKGERKEEIHNEVKRREESKNVNEVI